MNRTSDLFDDRIAEWLETDPTSAPPQVLETVLAAMPQISQRRARPWSLPGLTSARRLALVLALLVVGALLIALGGVIVGPPPSPSPAETTFTSPVYGYTVRYPATWNVVPGIFQLDADALPCALCQEPDNIWVVPDDTSITIAGSPLPAGATLESWTTSVTQRMPAKYEFGSCLSSQEATTVGGEPATLTVYKCPTDPQETVLWITLVHAGAGWHLVWTDRPNVEPATIRPKFDAFLATFAFGSAPLPTASAPPSAAPPTLAARTASPKPSQPLPAELIGGWYNAAPGWWWFLRAGDPMCVQAVQTDLDCVVWQRGTTPREIGPAFMVDGQLHVNWKTGFCSTNKSFYSVALQGDSLVLVDIGGGCDGGTFALTRPGTGSAPTAGPQPTP